MPEFTIGSRTFARKGDALAEVRRILWETPVGSDAPTLIHDLLDMHPNREEKIAAGVDRIRVLNDDWGSRCFAILTPDGEDIAFSYKECLTPSTTYAKVISAMRLAITPQVRTFRDALRADDEFVCALTGVQLTRVQGLRHSVEVDHAGENSFSVLANAWLNGRGLSEVPTHQQGQFRHMSDAAQLESWRCFHRERATLRLLAKSAHADVSRMNAKR